MRLGLGEQTQKTKLKSEAGNRILNGPEYSAGPFISKKKRFSKVPFVGTLNLYLVTPDALQKTKNWSDHPGLGKRLKTVAHWTKSNIVIFLQFLAFSEPRMIGTILRLLHCIRHHKITSLEYPQRVLWRHFFFTFKGVCAIFRAISDTVPGLGFKFRFLHLFTQTQSHTFGT